MPKDLSNIKISLEQEQKLKKKTPDNLPLNPTSQGYSGQEVRRFFAKALIDEDGSLLSEIKAKLTIIEDLFQNIFNENFSPAGVEIEDGWALLTRLIELKSDAVILHPDRVSKIQSTVRDGFSVWDLISEMILVSGSTRVDIESDEIVKITAGNHYVKIDKDGTFTFDDHLIFTDDNLVPVTTLKDGLMSASDKVRFEQAVTDISNLQTNKLDKTTHETFNENFDLDGGV